MCKLSAVIGVTLFGLVMTAAPVLAQSNPVDRVSNPNALDFTNVEVSPQEMNPPFILVGRVLLQLVVNLVNTLLKLMLTRVLQPA